MNPIIAYIIAAVGVIVNLVVLARVFFMDAKVDAATIEQLQGKVKSLEDKSLNIDRELSQVKTKLDLLPVINSKVEELDKRFDRTESARERQLERFAERLESFIDRSNRISHGG
jgi:peptidoglycan hydrolase CwlO-like protein